VPFVALVFLLSLGSTHIHAAWANELRLTYDAAESRTCTNNGWSLVGDGQGRVNVVWQDYRMGPAQLFYKLFVPNQGWSGDTQITTSGREDLYPSASGDSAGNLYVVWQGRTPSNHREVWFRKRDVTVGWQSPESVTGGSTERYNPSVAAGRGDTVHAAWFELDGSVYQVYYSRRTSAGWSAPVRFDSGPNSEMYPSVAADRSGNVYVVYRSHVGSYDQIFYRRYASGAWGDTERITSTSTSKLPPSVAVDRTGKVHVVWTEYDGTSYSQVYYAYRDASWHRQALTSTLANKVFPSVATDSQNAVHVVWSGRDSAGQPTEQVYYRLRTGTGVWQAQQQLSTSDAGTRERASVRCVQDGNPNVVWCDSRDGNWEVYYVGPLVTDVSAVSIIAPSAPAVVDSGAAMLPEATVRNYGSQTANFNVTFKISPSYSNTQSVSVLSESIQTVTFSSWTPTVRGNFTMRCSTFLSGDVNSVNDTVSGTGRVRVTDVTAYRVVKPLHWATIDSGTAVPCTAYVRNQGTDPASVPVTFRIASWSDSRTTSSIGAGDSVKVGFNNWTALPRGRDSVRCTTALSGDQVAGNNRAVDSVFVRVVDVGTFSVIKPVALATYNLNTWVPCTSRVANYGNVPATFYARMFVRDTSAAKRVRFLDSVLVNALPPGNGLTVGFHSYHADTVANGLQARCTTDLAGDVRSGNDYQFNSFNVIGHDVYCSAIFSPLFNTTYDSGTVVPCTCRVTNGGGQAETFWVKMWINPGLVYLDSGLVNALGPGASVKVGFKNWSAITRGMFTARCSTCLNDDNNGNNARNNANIFVRVRDVGTALILLPLASVDSGPPIAPVCSTANYGNSTENYNVRFKIGPAGSLYNQAVAVSNHAPGLRRYVVFPNVPNLPRGGPYALSCSTEFANDVVPINNKQTGNVTVQVREAGVTGIIAPLGTVDSGAVLVTAMTTRNNGTTTETYQAVMTIGGAPQALSITHDTLQRDSTIRFLPWTALSRGKNVVKCSLGFTGDANPGNNVRSDSVFVRVRDAALVSIIAPRDSVLERAHVIPVPVVANRGTGADGFQVRFEIRALPAGNVVYSESLPVSLQPGLQDTLANTLPEWVAQPAGNYLAWAKVFQIGDQRADDDSVVTQFKVTFVANHDVGARRIVEPLSRMPMGSFAPAARVANFGDVAESFRVFLRISADSTRYLDSATATALAPQDSLLLAFREWQAVPGSYVVRCSTVLASDPNHANDTISLRFTIDSLAPGAWTQLLDMPSGAKRKKVKAGADVAYRPADEIYALKGGGVNEFYVYDLSSGWDTRDSVPVRIEKKKKPGKGAALAYSAWDDKLYVLKGNNTTEFWSYDPLRHVWAPKPDIPLAPSNKALKGGSSLCYSAQDSSLYALKGSKTLEFWRYDLAQDTWVPAPQVPFGVRNKPVADGGALASDGAGRIYALKGNNTAEFYAYQVMTRSWITLDTVPAGPKRKKVKDGAVLAADGSSEVYAFKGNNVSEFYSYNTSLGYWEYRQQLPLAPSNKRLKNGSSLVFGAGKVYALKGNSTLEFWVFDPSHGLALNPAGNKPSVQSAATTLPGGLAFELFPNPAVDFVSVLGTVPAAALLRLYDVSGRQVVRQAVNLGSTTRLDLRNLTAGVYLLVLETGNRSQARQLVIEH
jgi:hypothetical protein